MFFSGATLEAPGILKRNGVRVHDPMAVGGNTNLTFAFNAFQSLSLITIPYLAVAGLFPDRLAHQRMGAQSQQMVLRFGMYSGGNTRPLPLLLTVCTLCRSRYLARGVPNRTSRRPQHARISHKMHSTSRSAPMAFIWAIAGGPTSWEAARTSGTR